MNESDVVPAHEELLREELRGATVHPVHVPPLHELQCEQLYIVEETSER